jgi:hypothetical protein
MLCVSSIYFGKKVKPKDVLNNDGTGIKNETTKMDLHHSI